MSIEVCNLSFSYDGQRTVLDGISFSAEYGEFLSVLGPNGVGKSTLFRCMLGIYRDYAGEVCVDGVNIASMDARQLARAIAYIPQSHSPAFNYSVSDMVLMGTTSQMGLFSSAGEAQKKMAADALEHLGIAHLAQRGYRQISGGERQLVLIARAIAQQAKILVMDEPSANLDFGNKMRVMQMAKRLTSDGYTVIQSTHDPDQAYLYSDKVLALCGGRVLKWGTPQEVVCPDVISAIYGVDVDVCSLREDEVRVCVPAGQESSIGRSF